MANRLIEPTLLFDFSINLKSLVRIGSSDKNRARPKRKIAESTSERVHGPSDWDLDQSHELPNFAALAGYPNRATVWAGWAMDGMYFKMKIAGKSLPPRFFGHSGGVSDGLRVWIDTRSSPGVHRATRFCHCFHFFPGQSAGMEALASKDFQGSGEAEESWIRFPDFEKPPTQSKLRSFLYPVIWTRMVTRCGAMFPRAVSLAMPPRNLMQSVYSSRLLTLSWALKVSALDRNCDM
jgi:hypothetical protein